MLRDNLFGLEIDPRCVQIAAFALALTAWKIGGYRELPALNVACSGIAVGGQLEAWTRLAVGDANMERTLKRLRELFVNAPDMGSLIDPMNVPVRGANVHARLWQGCASSAGCAGERGEG